MSKFTNESDRGRRFANSFGKETKPTGKEAEEYKASYVNPAVCLGPLKGEPKGSVDINSPAYTGKFGK